MPDVTPEDLFNRGWRQVAVIDRRAWISPDGERIVAESDALAEVAQERGDVPASKVKESAA
jgi:hypothetical protein